ncbi:MAG TPA: DUF3800 domain-containing protein [Candidatus Babeliaceae bacterium]|nr:DUF3800 domain-containing protein [Candidatus Babeliaceae bacterium]
MNNSGKQIINIFLDDSGVFVGGQADTYFIYAGYVFIGKDEKDDARRQYRTLSDAIRKSLGRTGELKAQHLTGTKHKRSLVTVLKNYESLACVVHLPSVRQSIMGNKLSIHRYKDYALKIAIKRKLQALIGAGRIDPALETELNIFIDEQHTSTNGFYSLRESIREEFVNGIHNLDYGTFYPPLFTGGATITVQFCDSSSNYLIQASDCLANRMYTSFNYSLPKLRQQLPKLDVILLP